MERKRLKTVADQEMDQPHRGHPLEEWPDIPKFLRRQPKPLSRVRALTEPETTIIMPESARKPRVMKGMKRDMFALDIASWIKKDTVIEKDKETGRKRLHVGMSTVPALMEHFQQDKKTIKSALRRAIQLKYIVRQGKLYIHRGV